MPTSTPIVTLRDIAREAELSVATVSYALRGNSKIAFATRQHVQQIALAMGFKPNPRVAALMTHIRNARNTNLGEGLAFVWVFTSRKECCEDPFLQRVWVGARHRAQQLGFSMEPFWMGSNGVSGRRLAQILQARGINGVVFSPVLHRQTVSIDFPWSQFSCACVGHALWEPEMDRAAHNHYRGMWKTLEELERAGYSRPGVILNDESNQRASRSWEAAFRLRQSEKVGNPFLLLRALPRTRTELLDWLEASRPDVLILNNADMVRAFRNLMGAHPSPPLCVLDWTEDLKGIPGLDQRYDLIAGNAVDLVTHKLGSNERGTTDLPRSILYDGRWVGLAADATRQGRRGRGKGLATAGNHLVRDRRNLAILNIGQPEISI